MARLQSCAAQVEGDRKRAKRLLQGGLKLSAESGDQTTVAYSTNGQARSPQARDRASRRSRANQPSDRPRALDLRAHRRKPHRQDPQEAWVLFTSPDRRLGSTKQALFP